MFCHKSGRVSDTIYDKDIESFDGSRRGSCQTVSTVETWLSDFDIVEERPFQQKDRGKVELEHVVAKKEENLSSNPLKFLFLLLMGKIEYLQSVDQNYIEQSSMYEIICIIQVEDSLCSCLDTYLPTQSLKLWEYFSFPSLQL